MLINRYGDIPVFHIPNDFAKNEVLSDRLAEVIKHQIIREANHYGLNAEGLEELVLSKINKLGKENVDTYFSLEEYYEMVHYMKATIGLSKPVKEKKYVVPFNNLSLHDHYLKKLSDIGLLDCEVINNFIYSYTLTRKGADYLGSILGIEIKL